jgi:MinD superfamily P-loop ATPase
VRELVVISGKGGTGKTSVLASFAALAEGATFVDCDVETPDLHLVLDPQVEENHDFSGGEAAYIRWSECIGCGRCAELCRWNAIQLAGPPNRFAEMTYTADARFCEGCRLCAEICPGRAIEMHPVKHGEWFISRSRHGPMIHAQLRPGRGNSGKLVSLLRQQAHKLAKQNGNGLILSDGVPGVGCPVIASIRGADLALVVAEPSIAGLSDFQRVLTLTKHFRVPTLVCVNKFDVDETVTAQIELAAAAEDVTCVGRVPSDTAVVAAQIAGQSVIEHGDGPAATALREIWSLVQQGMQTVPRKCAAN